MNEHIQESLHQIIQVMNSPLFGITSVYSESSILKLKTDLVSGYLAYLKKQKKLSDDLAGLSYEEYVKYFEDKIERAKTMGKFGWVISPHMEVGDETKIALDLLSGANEKKYVKTFFYTKNIISSIVEGLCTKYEKKDNLLLYLNMFKKSFQRYDYTSAAMYLCGIIDYRMKQVFQKQNLSKYHAILGQGIDDGRAEYYKESKKDNNKSNNIFILTEYLTSFQEYAKRTFTEEDGHKFGENEPPYFNRNWLMHGYSTRKVQRFQTLQLLNALSCLETVIDGFKEYNLYSE